MRNPNTEIKNETSEQRLQRLTEIARTTEKLGKTSEVHPLDHIGEILGTLPSTEYPIGGKPIGTEPSVPYPLSPPNPKE